MEVRRGDLVIIALPGDYGKPRPGVVVQDDAFRALESVTVLRLTSELHPWPQFRVTVQPSESNGLRKPSQVMVDKAVTVPRRRIGQRIGRLDDATLQTVDTTLARFLGLAV
jgi:mRNA interferase MazF